MKELPNVKHLEDAMDRWTKWEMRALTILFVFAVAVAFLSRL